MFVVGVAASIVPLLAYLLQYITDRAFPSYVNKRMTNDLIDYSYESGFQSLYIKTYSKNITSDDNGKEVILDFYDKDALVMGIIGLMAICVPFIAADYAMGMYMSLFCMMLDVIVDVD